MWADPAVPSKRSESQHGASPIIAPSGPLAYWWRELPGPEWDTPQARDQTDMTSLLGALVSEGFPVAGVATHASWGEIDCPSDVALYERIYPDL